MPSHRRLGARSALLATVMITDSDNALGNSLPLGSGETADALAQAQMRQGGRPEFVRQDTRPAEHNAILQPGGNSCCGLPIPGMHMTRRLLINAPTSEEP